MRGIIGGNNNPKTQRVQRLGLVAPPLKRQVNSRTRKETSGQRIPSHVTSIHHLARSPTGRPKESVCSTQYQQAQRAALRKEPCLQFLLKINRARKGRNINTRHREPRTTRALSLFFSFSQFNDTCSTLASAGRIEVYISPAK